MNLSKRKVIIAGNWKMNNNARHKGRSHFFLCIRALCFFADILHDICKCKGQQTVLRPAKKEKIKNLKIFQSVAKLYGS